MKRLVLLMIFSIQIAFSAEVLLEKRKIEGTYLNITYICINGYTYIVIGEYNRGNTMSPMISQSGNNEYYMSCGAFKMSKEYREARSNK